MDQNGKGTDSTVTKEKFVSIMLLRILSIMIMLAGALLAVVSFAGGTYVTVLTSRIPGAVFGLVILFLGIRYFLSVRKLKAEVYKSDSKFSWSNFRQKSKGKM